MRPTTSVVVKNGDHQATQVPPGAAKFLEQQLRARGISGNFVVRWGVRRSLKGRARNPFIKVTRDGATDRGSVAVIIQPGGKDTAAVAYISPDGEWSPGGGLHDLAVALATTPRRETRYSKDGITDELVARVIAARGPAGCSIEEARADLTEVFGERSNHGWGQILGAVARRGLLQLTRDADGRITLVRVATGGAKKIAAAPSPEESHASASTGCPSESEMATVGGGYPPEPPDAARRPLALAELLLMRARLETREDALTTAVLEAEERAAALAAELDAMRARATADAAELDRVSRDLAATRVVIAAMEAGDG